MSEILLKQIDGNTIDLSFNENFMIYYNNPTSFTKHIIEKEINLGHYQDPQFMKIFENGDATVIDAGANIGLFSFHIAPKCKHLYAIEPTHQHLQVLTEIAQAKNINCIIPEELALNNYTGSVNFLTDQSNTTQNRIDNNGYGVSCETLLDFIIKRDIEKIDLLKLDIEGGEKFVVLGDETFEKATHFCNAIYIEIHPPLVDPNAIFQKISNLGYSHKFINSTNLNNFLNILFYR